jgi:hypothetical protein
MPIEVRRASRKKVRMRLGLCAPAGGGKTMGALLVAYGLVGDWAKIGLVDTEAGSGELYTGHRVPGSTFTIGEYLYVRLDPPFTVSKYMEAQQALEEAGCECIVLDSISHCWSGAGGLLDQQGRIADRTGNSYTAWRDVTPQHSRFIDGMLQSPAHIIATMRSKTEYVLETNEKGKQAPRKVGMAPVQREGLDFEFTTVFDLDAHHMASASKDRTSLFDGEFFRLTPDVGKKLLAWLNTGVDAPKPERKLTISEWLDTLQTELSAASDAAAIEAIARRDDVQRALGVFRNGALTRLREMLDAAREGAAEDAIWPPDAPAVAGLTPDERMQWPGREPEKEAA